MACYNVTLFNLGAFKMRNCAICIVSVGLTHFPCNISLSFIHRVGILPTFDLGSNHRPAICKAEKYHSTPTNSAKGMDFKLYVSKGRQLVFQQCNVSTLAVPNLSMQRTQNSWKHGKMWPRTSQDLSVWVTKTTNPAIAMEQKCHNNVFIFPSKYGWLTDAITFRS